jgi:iron complex outermembrane receptor protein
VRLRGFEIEAKGNLTGEIKLIAGYSYLDARHTAGDQAGFKVESLPRHVASLWAIYTFQEGGFKGFSFGGGIRYNGSSWDGFDQVETPSFTLFDAMLSYETERWTWTLNATNLEDEYHLTTCLNRGDCFIGAGREITTGLTYKF